MATLTYFISPYGTKRGEHAIYFEVRLKGSTKRFHTGVFVREEDLSSDCRRIKNHRILSAIEHKRLEMLDKLYAMELKAMGERDLTAEWAVEKLLSVPKEQEFFAYAEHWLERCTLSGKRNYESMLNKLEEYLGKRYLPFVNLNYSLLTGFEKFLSNSPRAVSLYLGAMRHVFREAVKELNTDYEKLIHDDPFTRYTVPRQKPRKTIRALTKEDVLRIYEYQAPPHTRVQLARDCFILSFCLMGMNAADLFDCSDYSKGTIRYNRMKTRNRRADEAYIEVDVHPILKPLMTRYRGSRKVFNFSVRYSSTNNFNSALSYGCRELGKELGIPGLQFYMARHTFATLSRNLMRFAKSDVDEALNHVGDMSMADVYIKRDFSIINENNRKLIEEVFKDYL